MTADENEGKRILLVQITLLLTVRIAVLGYLLVAGGAGGIVDVITRFVLTAGLCVWVYRGNVFAKWLAIVVWGIIGLFSMGNVLSSNLVSVIVGGVHAAVYLSFALVLLRSSRVKAFLRFQRGPREHRERVLDR